MSYQPTKSDTDTDTDTRKKTFAQNFSLFYTSTSSQAPDQLHLSHDKKPSIDCCHQNSSSYEKRPILQKYRLGGLIHNKPPSWRDSYFTSSLSSVRSSAQKAGPTAEATRSLHNWPHQAGKENTIKLYNNTQSRCGSWADQPSLEQSVQGQPVQNQLSN